MRYVIYGAGAVGGVVGASLSLAGLDVTLVARGEHLAAIRERGLVLDRADGRHTLHVRAAGTAADADWDGETIVLLTVKSQQTAAALDDIHAQAPARAVVCVQNGVASEREVLRRFGAAYGVCVMAPTSFSEPGVVVQHSAGAPAILDVGRYPSGADETAEAIAADFGKAGIVSDARADIMAWKYRKLIQNLSNGVDAASGRGQASRTLVDRAQAEGEAVLTAAGISAISRQADRERRGDHLAQRTDRPGDRHSSTWQSLARGTGSTEVDYLSGEVVLLGRLHDVPTPVNELIRKTVTEMVRAGEAPGSRNPAELLAALPQPGSGSP